MTTDQKLKQEDRVSALTSYAFENMFFPERRPAPPHPDMSHAGSIMKSPERNCCRGLCCLFPNPGGRRGSAHGERQPPLKSFHDHEPGPPAHLPWYSGILFRCFFLFARGCKSSKKIGWGVRVVDEQNTPTAPTPKEHPYSAKRPSLYLHFVCGQSWGFVGCGMSSATFFLHSSCDCIFCIHSF